MKNGYTPSKSNKEYWENGSIPWFRMEDIRENGRILDNSLQHISKSAVKGGKLFPANSIIMATSATIGEHALITVPFLANQRFTSLSLKPEFADKLSIYFLYYYCFNLSEWCKKNTTTSSFASVDMNGFKRFPIPIPPTPRTGKNRRHPRQIRYPDPLRQRRPAVRNRPAPQTIRILPRTAACLSVGWASAHRNNGKPKQRQNKGRRGGGLKPTLRRTQPPRIPPKPTKAACTFSGSPIRTSNRLTPDTAKDDPYEP